MKPIIVEHVFVTPMPSADALQTLEQILTARGFALTDQQWDPDRPDWMIALYHRGVAGESAIPGTLRNPQNLQMEWDRGRVSIAISLRPHRINSFVRAQCADFFLLIEELLERVLTGKSASQDVLVEWAKQEAMLVGHPEARRLRQTNITSTPIRPWLWVCLIFCAAMIAWTLLIASVDGTGKIVLVLSGLAAAALLVLILLKRNPPIAPDQARLMGTGLAGFAWSVGIAGIYLMPGLPARPTPRPAPVQASAPAKAQTPVVVQQRVPQTPQYPPGTVLGGPGTVYPGDFVAVSDMDSADRALQSNNGEFQQVAMDWLSHQEAIPPYIHNRVHELLGSDDSQTRYSAAWLFCKDPLLQDVPTYETICRQNDNTVWLPAFTSLLIASPDDARQLLEDRSQDDDFVQIVGFALQFMLPKREYMVMTLLKSDNAKVVEMCIVSLRRAGTMTSIPAIQAAQSRDIFHGSLDHDAKAAIDWITARGQ